MFMLVHEQCNTNNPVQNASIVHQTSVVVEGGRCMSNNGVEYCKRVANFQYSQFKLPDLPCQYLVGNCLMHVFTIGAAML